MKYLQLNKLLFSVVLFLHSTILCWGHTYDFNENGMSKFNFSIELKKAHLSGILILLNEDKIVKASVINEFGVSALDFIYYQEEKKVSIENIMKKIDRWYIRKVLKRDLVKVIETIKKHENKYENKKTDITYLFEPLCD